MRSGKGAFEGLFGQKSYAYMQDHPAEARIMQDAMADFSRHYERGLIDAYDFARAKHIVDVGGGNGTFLVDVLRHAPNARGTVAELPQIAPQARDFIAASGMDARCAVVETDMFASVPAGDDLYVLKRCLDNWPDAEDRKILENVRAVLPSQPRSRHRRHHSRRRARAVQSSRRFAAYGPRRRARTIGIRDGRAV